MIREITSTIIIEVAIVDLIIAIIIPRDAEIIVTVITITSTIMAIAIAIVIVIARIDWKEIVMLMDQLWRQSLKKILICG